MRAMTWIRGILASSLSLAGGELAHGQQGVMLQAEPSRTVRDSRGGGGAAFSIASMVLKQTRHIDVALPASFARTPSDRRYPVIVVFDGESALAPLAAVTDELSRNGLIPESIIVAIENEDAYDGRVHDLTPPGLSVSGSTTNEGGDLFLDFIEKELLPAVDRQFRGGTPRVLMGHSSGAILATYAAATRPSFHAVVAIDAPISLGGNWLAKRLAARATSDTTPLRFAYYQAQYPWPDAEWQALEAKAPRTWKLHRERMEHEGHETTFMVGAYHGLREVFADYSRLAAPAFPTTSILPYYGSVNAAFGAELVPPRQTVRDVIDNLLMEGRGAAARDAFATLVRGYGPPNDGSALLSQIAEVEQQPAPTETVEALLATPAPSAEQARAYLGEWKGDLWRGPNAPRTGNTVLRVRIADGRVVAEMENPNAPPALRVRTFQYLKVTPAGLSFGMMNGMRPFGIVLNEGVLHGDTLSGTSRWAGINPPKDGGMPMEKAGFSFVRVPR